MSLAELKKRQAKSFNNLQETFKNIEGGPKTQRVDDDRYWKPTQGADGNGSAIIRFLPEPEGEKDAIVHYFKYQFKWPKTQKYYYERSLSSLGLPDPVADYKKMLRDTGQEELSKKMNRSAKYISNILVVKDPGNPENEGKVFLYEYGKQIYDIIKKAMTPDEELGREAFNPFDMWDGKNFVLKVKKKSDFPNYEDSSFQEKSGPIGKDSYIEEVYGKLHSLAGEVSPDKYLSYSELETKLKRVVGEEASDKNYSTSNSGNRDLKKELDDDIDIRDSDADKDIDALLEGINLDD